MNKDDYYYYAHLQSERQRLRRCRMTINERIACEQHTSRRKRGDSEWRRKKYGGAHVGRLQKGGKRVEGGGRRRRTIGSDQRPGAEQYAIFT